MGVGGRLLKVSFCLNLLQELYLTLLEDAKMTVKGSPELERELHIRKHWTLQFLSEIVPSSLHAQRPEMSPGPEQICTANSGSKSFLFILNAVSSELLPSTCG